MPNTPEEKLDAQGEFISVNKEIDVVQIMDTIKKRIREKKESGVLKQSEIDEIIDMELLPLPDFLEVPNVYEPHLYPGEGAESFRGIRGACEDLLGLFTLPIKKGSFLTAADHLRSPALD